MADKQVNIFLVEDGAKLDRFLAESFEVDAIAWGLLKTPQRTHGSYHGRPCWGNGALMEFTDAPPPEVMAHPDWPTESRPYNPDAVFTRLATAEEGRIVALVETMTVGDPESEGVDCVLLEAASGRAVAAVWFIAWFWQRYPGCSFHLGGGGPAPIFVKQGDVVVGIIMPQNRPELWAMPLDEAHQGKTYNAQVFTVVPRQGPVFSRN